MEIKSPSNFFNYYKDCYRLDYKEFTVHNVLNPKYKFKWFKKGKEELINAKSPIVYYDNKDVEKLEKELFLYKLEKSLYYGAFYFLGKDPLAGFSKDAIICSPLILFPCEIIEKDEDKFIKIDAGEFILNSSFLNKIVLNNIAKEKLETRFTEIFSDSIENGFEIKKALDTYCENIDTSELMFYPQNWSISKIRSFLKVHTPEQPFKIVPASGTIFIEKSIGSTKVITDLNAIANENALNTPLQELFNNQTTTHSVSKSYLENRLNPEQFKALNNSHQFNNSIIIGPPGTGKSYTISAIAVDAILQKKSVLVVSKTKQAVEVIRKNLINDFDLKDLLIHTSGHRFKTSLKAKIKRKLSGIVPRGYGKDSNIESLHKRSKKLAAKFEKLVLKELELSELTFKDKLTFREYFKKILLKFDKNENIEFLNTVLALNINSNQIINELRYYVRCYTNTTSFENASEHRSDLSTYYDALNAASFSESQHIIDSLDFKKILTIFPLWLTHLSELNTVFPQTKEMFDLVIIDEATQCDIATALPAIYRAKKVIICGDPNQLRHYSFIGKKQQFDLQTKYELPQNQIFDYRNKSILDIYLTKVSKQEQVTFLREHYRSTPSLIEFNNQEFYDQQLEIIKSTSEFVNDNQIELNYINGHRDGQGINKIEAEKVLQKLFELVETHKHSNPVPTFGIITPFSSQAKYINKLINNQFDLKIIKEFDILCGTPYNFQGSEREIIIISFTVCNKTHHSAFTHLNKAEVLNVGTTRAKSFQYIYTSVDKNDLNKESLFAKYLNFIENYQYQQKDNEDDLDLYQQEVTDFLSELNIENIQCGYPYAGAILDVFFTHHKKHFFIDLIGYPGKFNNSFSIERYKTFQRAGIYTLPLHYRFWKDNKNEAKALLQKIIIKK